MADKEKAVEESGKVVKSGAPSASAMKAKNKRVWTLEACKKIAGRFESEAAWKAGSPSSFKAASSHKWVKACLEHQEWRQSENQKSFKLPKSA